MVNPVKAVKVSDEAYKLLEEVASKQQVAIKDIVTRAIFLYLKGIEVEPAGKAFNSFFVDTQAC
jgi:hypothetical protein